MSMCNEDGGGADADARLEQVAVMLERLALEIRGARPHTKVSPTEEPVGWHRGAVVRVTIRDRYYGRIGRLMGRRGRCFWDLRLEPRDGETARVIYKKQSSLSLVEE